MNISERLRKIASFIEHDAIVFDVGCDHALLSCFLVEKGICKKVYAGDNKIGPLNSAIKNIETYNLKDKVIPILSDGLEKAPIDTDTVIIAGMGFNNAIDILNATDINRFKRIVVQINNKVNELRKYISDHNFNILDEALVYEDDHFYEIIVFNSLYHDKYNELEIKYGPKLLNSDNPLFIDYLKYKKEKVKEILNQYDDINKKEELKEIETLLNKKDV